MHIRLYLFASIALLGFTMSARATSYNVTGTLQTGTFTGTFSVDATGNITGGSFSANSTTFSTFGTGFYQPGKTATYSFAYFHTSDLSKSFDLELSLPGGVYGGTPIFCTTTALCGGTDTNILTFGPPLAFNEVTSAAVTLAATPEPSSIALLGTGVLGIFGVARRRFAKA